VVKGKNCLHTREECRGSGAVARRIVNPGPGMINPQPADSMVRLILVIDQLNAQILVYNKFIIYLYMFRALCAHHQEVKIVLYSIWYLHTLQVAFRCTSAQVHVHLCTGRPPTGVMIPDAV